jgi:hypothetical protein
MMYNETLGKFVDVLNEYSLANVNILSFRYYACFLSGMFLPLAACADSYRRMHSPAFTIETNVRLLWETGTPSLGDQPHVCAQHLRAASTGRDSCS